MRSSLWFSFRFNEEPRRGSGRGPSRLPLGNPARAARCNRGLNTPAGTSVRRGVPSPWDSLVGVGLVAAATACAVPRRPAVLPPDQEGYVAVLSGEMPAALSQTARHSWIVVNVERSGTAPPASRR